ncbi:MAG: flavodoxin family protein [Acetobacterium sp.]
MSKKIVVLTGSPRKKGNSFAMTDAFVNACKEKGYDVQRFDTALMNISGCTACESCYRTEKACIYNDDFNIIAPAIEAADAVVFSCPVYWYSIPAQLKAVIDKFFSFAIAEKLSGIAKKKAALITCWEESGLDVGEGVLIPYQKIMKYMDWTSVGEVMIPGVSEEGAIYNTDGITKATKLADLI